MTIILDQTTSVELASTEVIETFAAGALNMGFSAVEVSSSQANDNDPTIQAPVTTDVSELNSTSDTTDADIDVQTQLDGDVLPEMVIPEHTKRLQGLKGLAYGAYGMAKENSSWAAAYTFKLAQEVLSSKEATDWFEDEVRKRNQQIKTDVKKLLDGNFTDYAALSLYFGEKKLVQIRLREGTSKFARIVKFALDLVYEKQVSIVSRYILVLEWLESNFSNKPDSEVADMVKAIIAAGGFEAVIRIQRQVKDARKTISKSENTEAPKSKTAVLNFAESIGELDFKPKHAYNGFVVLIGRIVEGKVQVLGELKLSISQFEKEVSKIDEMQFKSAEQQQNAA
jgi:hypothetical protein